jgi:FixJ family two-component response regulator
MTLNPVVVVIDDDCDVRNSVALLLESVSISVQTFEGAQPYLDAFNPDQPGCLIVDIRMPMISGLDLQHRLSQKPVHPPIIFMTGHGDVPMAVRAMKEGALEFIEKPFNPQDLLDSVNKAIALDQEKRLKQGQRLTTLELFSLLTDKEKQVFYAICDGRLNKQIASDLCISQSTVEVRRAKVMEKMKADSLSDLIRLSLLISEEVMV